MKTELEILNFLEENYPKCIKNIKIISKDKENKVSMVDNEEIKFFDFDEELLKRVYMGKNTSSLSGVDGLDIKNRTLYFIEFKNGNLKKEKVKIRLKALESLVGLIKVFQKFSFECDFIDLCLLNKTFILVYNEEKNSANPNSDRLKNLCDFTDLKEQLEQYKGNVYKNIYLLTAKQFEEKYLKKYY